MNAMPLLSEWILPPALDGLSVGRSRLDYFLNQPSGYAFRRQHLCMAPMI